MTTSEMGQAILLCDDLIFSSMITATAESQNVRVRVAKTPERLLNLAAERPAALALLDLHTPGLDIALAVKQLHELGTRVYGFGSHVDVATLKAARQAGCNRVMPRSQFVHDLNTELTNWLLPSQSPITIRRASEADAEVIVRYNIAIALETEHIRLDEPTVSRGVAAILTDRHKGFYFVAEIDGEVVGQTLVTFEYSDWRCGFFWWIQSVYVRSDCRRRGVFRSLYEHIRTTATADPNVIGLRLYVERENTRAQDSYTSLGMAKESYLLLGLYPLPGRESKLQSDLPQSESGDADR